MQPAKTFFSNHHFWLTPFVVYVLNVSKRWIRNLPPTKILNFQTKTKPRKSAMMPACATNSKLKMGWSESPLYFCSATETSRDVIQYYIINCKEIPSHPNKYYLTKEIMQNPETAGPSTNKNNFELYVDDFIACINNAHKDHIQHLAAQAMLYDINALFPPTNVTGHCREEPIS